VALRPKVSLGLPFSKGRPNFQLQLRSNIFFFKKQEDKKKKMQYGNFSFLYFEISVVVNLYIFDIILL